jgi:hypothetical protein
MKLEQAKGSRDFLKMKYGSIANCFARQSSFNAAMKRKLIFGAGLLLVLAVVNLSLLSFTLFRRSRTLHAQVLMLEQELAQARQTITPSKPELPPLQQLHVAAGGGDLARLRELLDARPELVNDNGENKFGNTPLHFAAYNGRLEAAAELIKRGAKVNAKNNSGMTPLHDAITVGNRAMVLLLLEHGADAHLRNRTGKDAFEHAAEKKRPEIVETLRQFSNTQKG